MSDWKEDVLGSVLEIKYGKDHKKLEEGNIPCFGSGGIMRNVEKSLYSKPSILIPRKGSLNNIMFQDKPFWTVDTMFWSKINEDLVFPKYLFYQLTLIDYTVLNVGSAVPSLTVSVINGIDIKLPPLPEQKTIAEVLSSLDDKIDLLYRQNKTLEQMAETLFRQWFVEDAKEDWEETISEIPIDIIDGDRGKNYPKSIDFFDEEYCLFLSAKNVTTDGFDFSQKQFITKEKDSQLRKGKLMRGDIILTTRGTVGNFSFYDDTISFDNIRINSGMIILRSKKYDPVLFYNIFKSDYFKKNLSEFISGSAQPQIPIRDFREIMIPFPTEVVINKYLKLIKPLYSKLFKCNKQIRTLEKMRDTLLPKLMSGEIKVSEHDLND